MTQTDTMQIQRLLQHAEEIAKRTELYQNAVQEYLALTFDPETTPDDHLVDAASETMSERNSSCTNAVYEYRNRAALYVAPAPLVAVGDNTALLKMVQEFYTFNACRMTDEDIEGDPRMKRARALIAGQVAPQATVEPLTDEQITMPELPKPWRYARSNEGRIEFSDDSECPYSNGRHGGYVTPWAGMHDGLSMQNYARATVRLNATPPTSKATAYKDLLTDSQWVNILNHDDGYKSHNRDEAIQLAVKLTAEAIAKNITNGLCRDCKGKGGFQESDGCEGYVGVMCEPCNGTGLATSKADTVDRNSVLEEAIVACYEQADASDDAGAYALHRAAVKIETLKSATPSTIKEEPTGEQL